MINENRPFAANFVSQEKLIPGPMHFLVLGHNCLQNLLVELLSGQFLVNLAPERFL